jgi:hypothetical protein
MFPKGDSLAFREPKHTCSVAEKPEKSVQFSGKKYHLKMKPNC